MAFLETAGGAAILSGAIQGASGIFSGIGARKRQREQNKANMKMAEYAYNKELEQWNRQNAYNSPQAQMARLKAAGINPHLAYSNGSIANQAGTMPNYQRPQMEAVPTISEAVSSGLASAAQTGLASYINLQGNERANAKTSAKIALDELKLDRDKLKYELERDYYNPVARLQLAQKEAEIQQTFWEYERVDGKMSEFQRNRQTDRELKYQMQELRSIDKRIRAKIETDLELKNEYNNFINQITVREEIDPRETPGVRRLLKAIDDIENVDVQTFLKYLVNVGATIFR